MSAHTPGPWFAVRHGQVVAMVGGDCRQVAATTGDAVMHGDVTADVILVQMANARLLAAAPELLAALKALMDSSADQTFCLTEDCGRCQECAARAAIAKAEGKR